MKIFRQILNFGSFALVLLILAEPALSQSSHTTLERFRSANEAYRSQDFSRAYYHWKLLAEAGHAKSQANLGLLYLRGKGVERDVDRALQWMERAAEQGVVSAQFNLGYLYSTSKDGHLDLPRSIQWYLAAAKRGHPQASFNLARGYESGAGIEVDLVEALRWVLFGRKIAKAESLKKKFAEFEDELRAKLPEESVARAVELAERRSGEEAVASTSAENAAAGEALVEDLNCVGCHGDRGISDHEKIPNLAGQRPEYLRAQLLLFRAPSNAPGSVPNRMSARQDRLMTDLANNLSDQNIADIAAYYADLPCDSPLDVDKVEAPPKAKRCAACHGEAGRSQRGGFPNLAGQKEGYLTRQLTLLRSTIDPESTVIEEVDIRHHSVMGRQAGLLSTSEIDTLAKYFASLSCQ